jgi:hypothetical protein
LGEEYVILKSENLSAIHLIVVVHKSILPYITYLGSNNIKTGFYNMIGNKGGVAVWFKIRETSIIFINCHLAGNID